MAKVKVKGKKKKRATKKKKGMKAVRKLVDTTVPISLPVGSVHFDEFLKACHQPMPPPKPIAPVGKKAKKKGKGKKGAKGKKKAKGKKGAVGKKATVGKKGAKEKKKGAKGKKGKKGAKNKKGSKSKKVGKTTIVPQKTDSNPTLFPLIKALLLPTDDDPFEETALFSVSRVKSVPSDVNTVS